MDNLATYVQIMEESRAKLRGEVVFRCCFNSMSDAF